MVRAEATMQAICEGEVVEGEKRHRQHQKVHSKSADRRVHEGARSCGKQGGSSGVVFFRFQGDPANSVSVQELGGSMSERN